MLQDNSVQSFVYDDFILYKIKKIKPLAFIITFHKEHCILRVYLKPSK